MASSLPANSPKKLAWAGASPQDLEVTFRELLKYSDRTLEDIAKHKSKELADNLFLATPKASAQDIAAKVRSLGWQVKRPQWDKRLGQRKIHRAMKPLLGAFLIATSPAKKGPGVDPEAELKAMQDAVIKIRTSRIGAMRAGWIPAMVKLGSRMVAAANKGRRKNLGYVQISITNDQFRVVIANAMPGIVDVDRKHNILGKAFHMRIVDMQKYIRRKQQELATIWNPTGRR